MDDDEILRRSLKRCFAAGGYDVTTAEHGMEALFVLEKEAIDVLLTDLAMPGIAGTEFVREVRRRWPRLGIVVLTAMMPTAASVLAVHALGVTTVFKPVAARELERVVAVAVEASAVARHSGKPARKARSARRR